MSFWPPDVTDPAARRLLAAARGNEAYAVWQKIVAPFHAIASLAAIAAGIGMLRLRPWGRKLAIGFGLWFAVKCFSTAVLSALYFLPALLAQAEQVSGAAALAIRFTAYAGLVTSILWLIFPALLSYFLNQPYVMQAFQPAALPPALPAV